MQIPSRLFLDSDSEYHLNLRIILSYLLLYQIDSHILMVARRFLLLYVTWMLIAAGYCVYTFYYPILLKEPILMWQMNFIYYQIYQKVKGEDNSNMFDGMIFMVFLLPLIISAIIFILLWPILLKKQPVAQTLYCNGDVRFFGATFPESLVKMTKLRKTHKPSRSWTYEVLLFRNMLARLKNVVKPHFWKLWWKKWVCGDAKSQHRLLRKIFLLIWLPISLVLVVLHTIPLFSVWANYVRQYGRSITHCGQGVGRFKRFGRCIMLVLQLIGIFLIYIVIWNYMVST